jgi:hypothetical protein
VVELPRLHSILRPASLNPYAVMVGIEACPCEGRGPTIHEFACRLGKFRSPCGSTHSKKYFTTETRRSRRRNILPAGAAVEQNQLLSSFPRKAGIQGNRQGAEHVALDSRFRGNDGVGRRRGRLNMIGRLLLLRGLRGAFFYLALRKHPQFATPPRNPRRIKRLSIASISAMNIRVCVNPPATDVALVSRY